MNVPVDDHDKRGGARLSIGALARASGVPAATIRTWERRYGFLAAARKPSGHRLYSLEDVPRVRRVAELIARGVRAAEAVSASEGAFDPLFVAEGSRIEPPVGVGAAFDLERERAVLLEAVKAFDAVMLSRRLVIAWGQLGALRFVRDCVHPLLVEVGTRWAAKGLGIRHEHFVSERVQDVMRTLRLPLEDEARGPRVVLATLPGEAHALGLHMVALLLNAAGCRVLMLGPDLPIEEIAGVAGQQQASAVGIGVSASSDAARSRASLLALRRALARDIGLVVGGSGAPAMTEQVEVLATLDDAHAWARRLNEPGGRHRGG
jgi:methanogenic corrinoid protein MtbC1